jgi:hypothetical protein
MRLASWAILGSLLINMAFGLVVAGAVRAARPIGAALAQCAHHAAAPAATHRPVSGHYLAAVRMGWEVG